jgi:hypothetical protein
LGLLPPVAVLQRGAMRRPGHCGLAGGWDRWMIPETPAMRASPPLA